MKKVTVVTLLLATLLLAGCNELNQEQSYTQVTGTLQHIDLYDIPYWMGKGGYSVLSMDIECAQVSEDAFNVQSDNDSWVNTFNFKIHSFEEDINYSELIGLLSSNITVYYETVGKDSYYRYIEREERHEISSNSSTPNN